VEVAVIKTKASKRERGRERKGEKNDWRTE